MAAPASTTFPLSGHANEQVSVHSDLVENNPSVARYSSIASTTHGPKDLRTVLHIYHHKECHKRITPSIDLKYESPLSAAKKAARKAKKNAKTSAVVSPETKPNPRDETCAYFLHRPYLTFHGPPKVLYAGKDKHAVPVVLIHGSAFWRHYTLQYGDSLADDVLDPRGVVAWKHNGGNQKEIKADNTKLKGYKVRTWRLWGETGKSYVHQVKADRKAGVQTDPDVVVKTTEEWSPARADGVVHLKWERPISRHTRQYHFSYSGVNFYWKGTKTIKKSSFCGRFLRYTHLKLVAKVPAEEPVDRESNEVCLATFTCSISKKKSGRLELYDSVMRKFSDKYIQPVCEAPVEQDELARLKQLKESWFYRIVVATGMCMIAAEKEKRTAVGEWIEEAAEGAGG